IVAPPGKRLHEDDNNSLLWNMLCGDVHHKIVKSTTNAMGLLPVKINGFPVFAPQASFEYLKSCTEDLDSEVEVKTSFKWKKMDNDFKKNYESLNQRYLEALESEGLESLEQLMGAVLVTNENQFRITCAEKYYWDSFLDPHAESQTATPSSVLTEESTTQYQGDLKLHMLKILLTTG
ncbi:hypothetical protein BGZ76_005381, partial [Entomortierella beljakovae]